jgi:hypothetical protein
LLGKKEHIDDLFASYLADYEEKAPGYVWHNLQMDLKKAKIRKRASYIRAIAASFALLLTFGLGFFSSDIALRNKYESRYLRIDPTELNNFDETLNTSNQTKITSYTQTEQNEIKGSNEFPVVAYESQNKENSLIYKLFDFTKDIFSKNSEIAKESSVLYNKNSDGKTANQLLIDTLLFKKENLSERGFLLPEKKPARNKWSLGTKFSPVYSLAENMKQEENIQNAPLLKTAVDENLPETKADEKSCFHLVVVLM